MSEEIHKSSEYEYGTTDYYHCRVIELENERSIANKECKYYREQLAKAHELLGRILHQTSERWDSVHISQYYPTDNLHNKRTLSNPEGK